LASVAFAPPVPPRLQVEMRHRIGALAIDIDFSLTQPWTILFGPSGSGKSTILRAIAGLIKPDFSHIVCTLGPTAQDGARGLATFIASDSHSGRFAPAHTRSIPLAPQTSSLFPHRTVRENVGYGIPARDQDRHAEVERTMSLFRIAHLANELPHAVSGGEAQRVNLARAAAAAQEGDLLLLDEPFTGLDLTLRSELMLDMKAWAAKRNLCVLSVTHEIAEAFQLDAEVIKLAEGRIVEQGPVASVLADERARLLEQLTPSE
jgi:molybdate transport system ATP-binding protein